MLRIESVDARGTGARLGLRAGDRVLEVNGARVRDELDFRFYGSDEAVTLKLARENLTRVVTGQRRFSEPWGIRFSPVRYRSCGNKCIFCFVDQNPKGLRRSLYFKDEDYRLSFLQGNYVTLTNVGEKDIRRIVEQHLSPLYVSVHATDPQVRKRLLGIHFDDRLLEKISALVQGGIELHAQIVLLPGYNDGDVLDDTLDSLWQCQPGIASVAVVPVGLTTHRSGLPRIHPVTGALAARVVERIEELAGAFKARCGRHWVYLADEFYLRANGLLPHSSRYDDFPQIENGVGMMRAFLDVVFQERAKYPSHLGRRIRVLLMTGKLAAPVLSEWILPVLNEIDGMEVEILPVRNNFFGDTVTVSGLLVGRDLLAAARRRRRPDLIILPANILNADGLFLDNMSPADLEKATGTRLLVLDETFVPMLETLENA